MRSNQSSLLALGTLVAISTTGCGQLWRPFLEANPGGECHDTTCVEMCAEPPCSDLPDMDTGVEWEHIPSGVTTDLYAVWATDSEKEIYVAGASKTLLRSTDPVRFLPEDISLKSAQTLLALTGDPSGPPSGSVYVSGDNGFLSRRQNGVWSALTVPSSAQFSILPMVSLPNSSMLWFTSSTGAAYYGPPGGILAQAMIVLGSSDSFTATYPANANYTWLVTEDGHAYRSKGTYTDTFFDAAFDTLTGIWAPRENFDTTIKVYAVGESGTVVTLLPTDTQFQPVSDPLVADFAHDYNGVFGNASGEVWIIGDGGLCLYFDGNRWQRSETGTTDDLYAIFVAPGSRRPWIVGENGLILRRRP